MALEPGTRLGHYEITAPIGRGGMGEVYRARDTKLGREVAIKVLPSEFSRDEDRLARLEREARMLAALNHPNIAAIYGLEQSDDTRFLVLELVEGETLADRLERGPIPVAESLKLALQIAEALEAAHEKGVVHRDLKPANIKVTPEGRVKVLDFGLARAFAGDQADVNLSNSPTLSMAATEAGIILGTAAYMSPEQARGAPVGKQTDIWALGCVLYETLSGRQAFGGESVSDILASVLKSDPEYAGLPQTTPARLRTTLERCLRKDPRQRWHDVGDLRLELEAVAAGDDAPVSDSGTGRPSIRWAIGLGAAVVLAIALGFVSGRLAPFGDAPPWSREAVHFTFGPPPGTIFDSGPGQPFEVSPDGRMLAFLAINADGLPEVWIRGLGSDNARRLPGTEGAWSPFWSPDSTQVAFYSPGALKRISVSGGDPVSISNEIHTRAALFPGSTGAWGPDGTIVFHTGRIESPLERISFQGGTISTATAPSETHDHFPTFLPDGRLLYSAGDMRGIYMAAPGGEPELIDPQPQWVKVAYSPGHLLHVENGTLFVRDFDEGTGTLSGDARLLVEGIPVSGPGRAPWSVSRNGVLAYRQDPTGYDMLLRIVDRDGEPVRNVINEPGRYAGAAISPDGEQVAYARALEGGSTDIYVRDVARGFEPRRSVNGDARVPVWSPDGSRLAFGAGADRLLVVSTADGSTLLDARHEGGLSNGPTSWGPDNEVLVYEGGPIDEAPDLFAYWMDEDRVERLPINTEFTERDGALSPDGEWIAYTTDRSGRPEVWIARFPSGGTEAPVSVDGGRAPSWRGDGEELFYVSLQGEMMAVGVDRAGPELTTSAPTPLFSLGQLGALFRLGTPYSVTADGERFLVPILAGEAQPPIHVILNWPALLEE